MISSNSGIKASPAEAEDVTCPSRLCLPQFPVHQPLLRDQATPSTGGKESASTDQFYDLIRGITRLASTADRTSVPRNWRRRFLDLRDAKWLVPALRCLTLPVPVILNLLAADFFVFCFDILQIQM